MSFWEDILGFKPEQELEVNKAEIKCYKCGSIGVETLDFLAWIDKLKCNVCKYYTFISWTDRMGGGLTDSIAIDKKDNKTSKGEI